MQRVYSRLFSETIWFPLLISIFLIVIRAPSLFYSPRFWAEEGTNYFRHALFTGFFENLFFVGFGYFNFAANLGASCAALLPLNWAPLGSTLVALGFQLLPTLIILDSRSKLFATPLRRAVALLIPIFTLKSTEVWLNSINSQYFATLSVFLLLLEDDFSGSSFRIWFRRLVLLACGFTGPGASMLTPLFFFKAIQTRNKTLLIDGTILLSCGLAQVSFLSIDSDGTRSSRFHPFDVSTFSAIIWVKTLLLLFLGFTTTEHLSTWLRHFIEQGGAPNLALLLSAPLVLIFYILIRKTPKPYQWLMPLSFFLIVTLTVIGTLGEKTDMISPHSGQRYFWAPNCIFSLWIFLLVPWEKLKSLPRTLKNQTPLLLITWILFLGVTSYWRHFYIPPEWPVWSQEVERYKQNHTYDPKIWPENWAITMGPDK